MSETMRPPINRGMRILDRSFFQKTVPLAAARIFNNQHISQCRQALQKSKDMLKLERGATSIRADPSPDLGSAGKKCLLLREDIKAEGEAVVQCVQTGKC
jgi:tRNA (guanine37-N1)-methyltransferase